MVCKLVFTSALNGGMGAVSRKGTIKFNALAFAALNHIKSSPDGFSPGYECTHSFLNEVNVFDISIMNTAHADIL